MNNIIKNLNYKRNGLIKDNKYNYYFIQDISKVNEEYKTYY